MTDTDLTGTASLVTGASSGMGAAVARDLVARGSAVALVARREDRLDAPAAELRDAGGRALALATDVTDAAQARTAVERTVDTWGRLDIRPPSGRGTTRRPGAPTSD
ncbi:SDR family NAD(P)-dependent oxidoreductase [Streptomyces sp. NPDC058001]|uniref:SDR family NAD(P)-dependent oxidoreductase n=1 Tax=Streptomyces sp. NPDC058001 TaxID=3346300 RepID=UPI0036EF4683